METHGMTVIERDTMEAIQSISHTMADEGKSIAKTLAEINENMKDQNILLKRIADALERKE